MNASLPQNVKDSQSEMRDRQLLRCAKQYVECVKKNDTAGATAALRDMVAVDALAAPQAAAAPVAAIATEKKSPAPRGAALLKAPELVLLQQGSLCGLRLDVGGASLQLNNYLRGKLPDGSTVAKLYLKTSSGNIYLIERDSEHQLTFCNAKSRTDYRFPPTFPQNASLTIGSPFVAELLKNGKVVTRYTSPVTEAVFVLTGIRIPTDAPHCSMIEEYDSLAGVGSRTIDSTSDLDLLGGVLLENRTILGARIRRASCATLFAPKGLFEGSGAVTHIFFSTESGNVYRIERDYPQQGQFCLSDARTLKDNNTAERPLSWNDLLAVTLEVGQGAVIGSLSTSSLHEIVAFNCDKILTLEESARYTEYPDTAIVDDFYTLSSQDE